MRKDRLLPVDAIARGHPGCVLGIDGAEPGFLRMTPWWSSSPWREAVLESQTRAREGHGVLIGNRQLHAVSSGRKRGLERR